MFSIRRLPLDLPYFLGLGMRLMMAIRGMMRVSLFLLLLLMLGHPVKKDSGVEAFVTSNADKKVRLKDSIWDVDAT